MTAARNRPRTPEERLLRRTRLRLAIVTMALVATLLRDLAVAYREAMGPALVGPGDARQRLGRGIDALFGVIDAHLPLLLASDQVFHRANAASTGERPSFRTWPNRRRHQVRHSDPDAAAAATVTTRRARQHSSR